MRATLADGQHVRPNQGGRPIDDLVAAFDAHFEAVVAIQDDRVAIAHATRGLNELHASSGRLYRHLLERLHRIDVGVLPPLRHNLVAIDRRLTARTATRRSGNGVSK